MEDDPDGLTLDSRRRIRDLLKREPGLHLRAISRALDMPVGTLEYHLRNLEKREVIVSRKEGAYKVYYLRGVVGAKEKRVLPFLRQRIPRRIILHLLLTMVSAHRDIMTAVKVAASTLSFHLKKLVARDVISVEIEGRERRYSLLDHETVADAVLSYEPSFEDELADRFVSTWDGLRF